MAALTLVLGDEEFLAARAISDTVEAAGAAEVHDVLAVDLDADQLAEMASPSLFGDRRVIVVRALQDATKDLVTTVIDVAAAGDDASFVLVHAGGVKGKALVELVKGAGARVVDVPRIRTGRDREQFVADEVRRAGGRISKDAVVDLIAAIGGDVRELATACVQLVADGGPDIGSEQVAAHYRGRVESTGFAVADRAVDGDVAGALETLRWAMATGLEPVLVSSSLAANLRTIAVVASAGRGSPDSLAGPLGMPAWKIRRAQTWVKRWRPEALATAVQAVARADADIKGAADDAAYAVERAVVTVAECVGR